MAASSPTIDQVVRPHVESEMSRSYLRQCRSPDGKRVTGAWWLYEDVNNLLPLNKGWDPPETPTPPPFEIRPVEYKGRGMFATRNIRKGELIVRERPVIMGPNVITITNTGANIYHEMEKNYMQLLYWLEQEDREKFVELHNCKSLGECGPLGGIVRTNGISAIFRESSICEYYSSVCLKISYVNHSCAANAYDKFDRESITKALRANRDIVAGEEITISYIDLTGRRAERQEDLRTKYRFTCTCSSCSSPSSDTSRQFVFTFIKGGGLDRLWDAVKALPPSFKEERAKETIKYIEESILSVIDEENLQDLRFVAIQTLSLIYASLRDRKNFRRWAREALGQVRISRQIDETSRREQLTRWIEWIAEPETIFQLVASP